MFKYLSTLPSLRKSLAGLPSKNSHRFIVSALSLAMFMLAGCGTGFRLLAPGADGASLTGFVRGGKDPVSGARLELYAAGNGDGAASTPVLTQPVVTNSEGWFSVAGLYTCPSPSSQMYLVATGGSTDRSTSASNQASVMMTALGRCDAMTQLSSIDLDEVTTVSSIAELAPYMQSVRSIGADAANAERLSDAFSAAQEIVTLVKQTSPGSSLAADPDSPIEKVATLANILSTCSNTTSDKAQCVAVLGYAAAQPGASTPDVATAMLQIANNPTHNVASLFSMHPSSAPFQAGLAAVPANWSVVSRAKVAAPSFSPLPGTFSGPVTLTMNDSTPGARIYYTTGDAWLPYTGPVKLSASKTVTAIALINGMSLLSTGNYSITPQAQVSASQPVNVASDAAVSSVQLPTPKLAAATGNATVSPSINFASGFTAAGLSLNGGAAVVGNALQLTDNNLWEARSAFLSTPVNVQAFTTDFVFQQTAANADGFTFTLQNAASGAQTVGGLGIDLGYGGIGSSVAVKFDLYNNAGEGTNSTGIYSNGISPTMPSLDLTPSGINLHSGDVMHANITYDGTTLTLTLTDMTTNKVFTTSTAINIPATVGGNTAYAGFTAGTGGLAAVQNILSWTYVVNATAPGINFASGFTSAGLSLNGGAAVVGNALQLTDTNLWEARSAFFSTPVNVQAFATDFVFQLNTPIADGFTFTLQNALAGANAVGLTGGNLGFTGIPSSVGVKFDLYNNAGEGPNSTGVYSNGAVPNLPSVDITPSGVNLHSGDVMHANITYDGTTLTLTLTDMTTNKVFTTSTAINIPATVGGNTAYAGFTAGTGGAGALQNILSWTYVAPAINFASGFTSAGLSMNGGARIMGNALQITDDDVYEARSAFFNTPVSVQSFTTDFTFQQNAPNADGFTFTLQNAASGAKTVGGLGIGLGYAGIGSSVAVKFDIYDNFGEGPNSTGIYSNGAWPTVPSVDLTPSGINLHSGHVMHANITYDGTTLTLTLTDMTSNKVFTTSKAINIPATVGGNTAYAGFTAGTGGLTAVQNILSWTYRVTSNLSLTPGSVSLAPSQTQQFTATAANATNPTVTWTLNPAVGSITATGLYTAPASLSGPQSVVVTATSVADATQTASAVIGVTPPVSVAVTPGLVTLMSTTQQFMASVTNATNTGVTWSLNPAIGSISQAGLYTAPSTVPSGQVVTVTATSVADTTKTASASITLAATVPAKLQFIAQPSDISTRGVIAPAVTVAVEDNNGNVVTNAANAVTIALTGATGLTGPLTAVPVNGIATFTGLAVPTVGTYTLTASSPTLASTVSTSFNVTLLDPGFSGPIVITKGGTYTGKWESLDPNVVTVRVVTNQPVIIQNSEIRGMCHLIVGTQMGLNLQISNVVGTAINPNVPGVADGIFLYTENAARIQVDHSTMIGVSSGLFIAGANATSMSLTNNVAINMDDRGSDGHGGKQLNRPSLGHFIIFAGSALPNGAEVAWNQNINTLGQSSVEDIINIYSSRGSANAPINIHDNYLQGAASTLGVGYSGGGMIIDGDQSSPDIESAYVLINNNQVVITQNNGISVPTGHDITVSNNRVVSSGKDSNGNWMVPPDNLGCGYCQVSNYNAYYYNNLFINNYGGLARQWWDGSGQRVDTTLTASSAVQNDLAQNFNLIAPLTDPNAVTPAMEAAEYVLWQAKLAAAGQKVGSTIAVTP